MDPSAEEKAKARKAIRLLYLAMAVGIVLPLVLFLLMR